MKIDVRQVVDAEITSITVCDKHSSNYVCEEVKREVSLGGSVIADSDSGRAELRIISEEHARNLIRAIEKTIQLGWY